jgi:ferredoxin--NADP+ reductase
MESQIFQQGVSQPSQASQASTSSATEFAHAYGTLALAAVAGAIAGARWWQRRDKASISSDSVTEMTAPKLAAAAFAGDTLLPSHAASSPRSVACNAAAVKKKGVRVVEGREVPWNIWSVKAPYEGKVVKNHVHPQTLTENTGDANWETCHVTFDHDGKVPYIEGQSIGVIAPGPDKKGTKPAKIRLYSIASSAVGDDETSKTVSLCVKRVVELDGKFANREVGEDKPDKAGTGFPDKKVYRGVCSNHICDMSPGDPVLMTGPTGAEMLLPEDQESNIIMLATGTGIAPMRSYMRLLFSDKAGANADGTRKFKGLAWLFMGVPYSKSLLYDDEHKDYTSKFPDQFRFDYAVSREDKNAAGQKMYIQTKMAEYREDLWQLMQDKKTHIYMCGLKGMEAGMEECFSEIAKKNNLDWKEFAKSMKKAGRYHVEVY